LARLGSLLSGADGSLRWRLIAEFLEEFRREPVTRLELLAEEPAGTGDEHWDVFLAALAEHLAARDDRAGPPWSESRVLRQLRFPFNTPAARVDAVVHAPIAFRRRGVYVARQELEVAGRQMLRGWPAPPSRRRSGGTSDGRPGGSRWTVAGRRRSVGSVSVPSVELTPGRRPHLRERTRSARPSRRPGLATRQGLRGAPAWNTAGGAIRELAQLAGELSQLVGRFAC
jgi:hypothetical protein